MHTDRHMHQLTEVAVLCLQNILIITITMMILFQEHLSMHTDVHIHQLTKVAVLCLKNILVIIIIMILFQECLSI